MQRPADFPDHEKGEPWAEPYGSGNNPPSPSWKTVHCLCSPITLAEPTLSLEWLRSYLCLRSEPAGHARLMGTRVRSFQPAPGWVRLAAGGNTAPLSFRLYAEHAFENRWWSQGSIRRM
jgi:hypothetical protein